MSKVCLTKVRLHTQARAHTHTHTEMSQEINFDFKKMGKMLVWMPGYLIYTIPTMVQAPLLECHQMTLNLASSYGDGRWFFFGSRTESLSFSAAAFSSPQREAGCSVPVFFSLTTSQLSFFFTAGCIELPYKSVPSQKIRSCRYTWNFQERRESARERTVLS